MLPADTIAEITTAIAALHLEPNTTAQILAAVFAPLLRAGPDLAPPDPPPAPIYKRRAGGRLRARPPRKQPSKRPQQAGTGHPAAPISSRRPQRGA